MPESRNKSESLPLPGPQSSVFGALVFVLLGALILLLAALGPMLTTRVAEEGRERLHQEAAAAAGRCASGLDMFFAERRRELEVLCASKAPRRAAELLSRPPLPWRDGRWCDGFFLRSSRSEAGWTPLFPGGAAPPPALRSATGAQAAGEPGNFSVHPVRKSGLLILTMACPKKPGAAVAVVFRIAVLRRIVAQCALDRGEIRLLDSRGQTVVRVGSGSGQGQTAGAPLAALHSWRVTVRVPENRVVADLVAGAWAVGVLSTLLLFAVVLSLYRIIRNEHRLGRLVAEANRELRIYGQRLEDMVAEQTADLRRAKEEAEEANRLKSEFLANMSHEIRTPLNAVIGFADLLGDSELQEDQKEYLKIIRDSAQSLLDLVSNILDFAKIERGEFVLDASPYSPRTVINDLWRLFHLPAEQKHVDFHADPGDLPDEAVGDAVRVRQVLTNLISNAIKFTPEGGRVVIRGRVLLPEKPGGMPRLEFSVRDTGIGISNEHMETIFEPFRQVDGGYTREFGGTGLGLAIVRRLVEQMNGEIRVESEPGKGSVFRFIVPLRQKG